MTTARASAVTPALAGPGDLAHDGPGLCSCLALGDGRWRATAGLAVHTSDNAFGDLGVHLDVGAVVADIALAGEVRQDVDAGELAQALGKGREVGDAVVAAQGDV